MIVYVISAAMIGCYWGSFFCLYLERHLLAGDKYPEGDKPLSIFYPPRSFCFNCRKKLAWYENLPVISFIFLKGKCSRCHAKIPFWYVIVEIFFGAAFFLVTGFCKFSVGSILLLIGIMVIPVVTVVFYKKIKTK